MRRCLPKVQANLTRLSPPTQSAHCGLGAVWKNRAVIDPSQDAFGAALHDYLEGKDVPELVLEDRSGWTGPAMPPEWFFPGL
jgi:hypothetical protein